MGETGGGKLGHELLIILNFFRVNLEFLGVQ